MAQTFRSLAEILRSAQPAPPSEPVPPSEPATSTEPAPCVPSELVDDGIARTASTSEPAAATGSAAAVEFCASLALVRLAAKEAYERAAQRLLASFARDVLFREFAIAPVDMEALMRATLGEFAAEEPVAVELSPIDAERVGCDIPVRINRDLLPGDLVVVVRDGTLDTRLGVRVAAALEESLK